MKNGSLGSMHIQYCSTCSQEPLDTSKALVEHTWSRAVAFKRLTITTCYPSAILTHEPSHSVWLNTDKQMWRSLNIDTTLLLSSESIRQAKSRSNIVSKCMIWSSEHLRRASAITSRVCRPSGSVRNCLDAPFRELSKSWEKQSKVSTMSLARWSCAGRLSSVKSYCERW